MSDRSAWQQQLDSARTQLEVVIESAAWLPEFTRKAVIWAIRLAVSRL